MAFDFNITNWSNTGIELIGNGEQAGTWGETTNVNWLMMEEMVAGVAEIDLTGVALHTLTATNSLSSDGRHMVIKYTGTPSAAVGVNVDPTDMQKVYIIENATTEAVTISQGNGGDVSIPKETVAVVYCDGNGEDAKVTSVVDGNLTKINEYFPYDKLKPLQDTWIINDYQNGTWKTTTGAAKLQTWTGKIDNNGVLLNATFDGSITEDVHALTTTTISASNGTIQHVTLTGDVEFTLDIASGQHVVLMVFATVGAVTYDVFWADEVDWKTEGNTKPTMNNGAYVAIVLWNINGQYFGARVGDS